jgi:hypothetical protein
MEFVPVPGDIREHLVQKVSNSCEKTFKLFYFHFQFVIMVTGD